MSDSEIRDQRSEMQNWSLVANRRGRRIINSASSLRPPTPAYLLRSDDRRDPCCFQLNAHADCLFAGFERTDAHEVERRVLDHRVLADGFQFLLQRLRVRFLGERTY